MLKKCFFSILWTMLVAAGVSGAATMTPVTPSKDGNCYQIGTAAELYGFAAIVNGGEYSACGVLTADIVVNEHVLTDGQGTECVGSTGSYNTCSVEFRNSLYTWTPIGVYNNSKPFQGTFDGLGHTISGLFDNNTSSAAKYTGLFGYVSGTNATVSIKNVGVEDSYFRVNSYAGGIVGMVYNGSGVLNIENVYSGSVLYIKGEGEVGGLVGYVKDWTLNITNAYNSGSIFGTSGTTTYSYVAGLVGYISSTATVNIKNAFNNGNLNGYAPLVNSNAKTVQNSFYLGETLGSYGVAKSSNEFSNGSVFAALRSSEEGSVWHQYQGEAYPTFVEKTGETPFVAHSAILHYSTTVSESIYFVEGAAVSLPTVDKSGNAILGWYANSGFTGTKYTEIPASANSDLTLYPKLFQLVDGCYEISDADMLYAFASIVNNDVNAKACGKLTADIVVNQNVLANVNTDGSLKDGVNFKQWIPIGESAFLAFKGSFNGQGHTISGLYFNDSGTDNVGLFGCVFGEPESITIENVGLVDSYFRGNNSVGGLVGNAYGLLTIKNSFNASSVNASEGNFGGLVGYSLKGSADLVNLTISNSYNVGSLNGASHGGGLVGSAVELTISNSYNTGSVSVNGSGKEIYVGGFAASAEKVTITNSYNFGSISSPNGVLKDDFVSYYTETNSTVTNSFYIGTCKFEGNGATKMTSDEFANGTVFAALRSGEDGEVWRQYSGDAYPTLVAKTGTDAPAPMHTVVLHYSETDSVVIAYTEGEMLTLPTVDREGNAIAGWTTSADGTGAAITEIPTTATTDLKLYPKEFVPDAEGYYEIATADDLYKFAEIVNNGTAVGSGTELGVKAKLMNDIVVNENVLATAGGVSNVNATTGDYTGTTGVLREWTPIGNEDNPFKGSFDGQGHTISGLYLDDYNDGGIGEGLFGTSSTASIENVGVVDSYFRGRNNVGGILGLIEEEAEVNIENVYSAAVVVGNNSVGGIVGCDMGFKSNVNNAYNVGLVFGVCRGENEGSCGAGIGGIVGYNYSDEKTTIHNSFNYGTVSAVTGTAGALVGAVADKDDAAGFSVTNSYYLGDAENGDYGTVKSEDDFSNGMVFAALRSGEDGDVWHQYKNDAYPTFVAKTGTDAPAPMHTVVLHYSETDSVVIAYTQGETLTLPTVDREDNAIAGWTTSADGTGAAITEIPTTATTDLKLYPKEFVPDAEGYYEIATADDLYKFAEIVNNGTAQGSGTALGVKAKLMNDIVVNENVLATAGGVSNVNATTGDYTGTTGVLREWIPIGNADHPFIGTFDGQGHTISGLYFNDHDGGLNVGLFGYIGSIEEPVSETVSISNVGIEDSYFKANSGVGGVVGYVENVALNMENVYNAAVVAGVSYVGGVVGFVGSNNVPLTLSMANVYNVGSVNGSDDGQTGGLVGDFMDDIGESKVKIKNSYNYGNVVGGNPLVGMVDNDIDGAVTVTNSFYLGSSISGDYGESKSSTEFANGTVLIALRNGEGGNVWVQNSNDKYPTIDINGSTNPYTLVLDWQSANDQVKLQDSLSKYSESIQNQISSTDVNVIVKEGKQFYADGKIYRGNIPTEDVSDICNNNKTLYPISGVELETDDKGLLVAILDGMDREEGDTAPAIMIPFDLTVDKVIYKREMTAGIYKTVMLPFNVANLKLDAYSNYGFYRFTSMDENVDGYRYMAMVYRVRLLQANMPYIMKNIGETDTEGIVFEGDGRITLNTVSSGSREFSATSNDSITWSMKGVYENKVWETGDPEIGSAYLFAGQKKDGYKIGEYAKLGAGASLQPMRMYLLKGALAQLNRPGMFGSVDHYGSPESIGVRFVDDEEFDEGEETMVEKRITVIPTVIKSNRWFDMKGRALDSKPTAKGNYYYNGKRITIK